MNHFFNNFDPDKSLPPELDNEYKTIMNRLFNFLLFYYYYFFFVSPHDSLHF